MELRQIRALHLSRSLISLVSSVLLIYIIFFKIIQYYNTIGGIIKQQLTAYLNSQYNKMQYSLASSIY